MTLQQVYGWAKKIHNFTMWLMLALGIPLATTGVVMENESLSRWAARMDWGYKVRELHRMISTKFVLALGVMMLTGLAMWAIPKILSRRVQSKLS